MLRALNLLAQLERQELDRERRALRALEEKLITSTNDLAALQSRQPAEHEAGWALPGGPGPLASYLSQARRQEMHLRRLAAELTAAHGHAQAALRERIASMKSLELAAEHLQASDAAQAAHRAQIELEEVSGPK